MSQTIKLKNNGKVIERFMSDFCTMINFCGGKADNSFYPLDFHIKLNDHDLYFECKEHHSSETPFYSFAHIMERDSHIIKQMKALIQLQNEGAWGYWLVWSENWKRLQINSPFHYFSGFDLKYILDNAYRGRNLQKVKIFSFFNLLERCPRYHDIFKDVPLQEQPYFTYDAPNIEHYFNDPSYSAWKFSYAENENFSHIMHDANNRPFWCFYSHDFINLTHTQQKNRTSQIVQQQQQNFINFEEGKNHEW